VSGSLVGNVVVSPEVAVVQLSLSLVAGTAPVAAAGGPTWLDSFTAWLDDPTVAFLLLALGILSVALEVAHPGLIGTGVAGVVLILLGLWSLSMQPVNTVGFALVLLAAALFLIDLFVPTLGVAAILGAVALLVGGVLLIDDPVDGGVPVAVVAPTAAIVGGAVILASRLALKARRQPSTLTGEGNLVGRAVTVDRVDGDGVGHAFAAGAWWFVRTAGAPIEPGTTARVVTVDGLVLVVDPSAPGDDRQRREEP
jgi:membrane-bound serine protease (ClpP class)